MHELSQFRRPQPRVEEVMSQLFEISILTIRQNLSHGSAYLNYFERQSGMARQNDNPLSPICTQENILTIVQHLKSGNSREEIKYELFSHSHQEASEISDYIDNAIDLAIRLWLMVHIGAVPQGVTSQTAIIWREGRLKDAMESHFQHEMILTESVKFQKVFNARNIERIADVTIQWTPNLVDHLRFVEDGRKPVLNIFYCAEFLEMQKENTIYPPLLIIETLSTLALLLPTHDQPTRKWFQKQYAKYQLDGRLIEIGQLKLHERQIVHFKYWHDRLIILKQYFDESKPRTFKQWWYDDRKRVQWFWVAIVLVIGTLLFGVVQSFEGGWQIWKAYHPS